MAQIIDTHTHFFDPQRPQGVPWPNPDNPDLYRTTLPEDTWTWTWRPGTE